MREHLSAEADPQQRCSPGECRSREIRLTREPGTARDVVGHVSPTEEHKSVVIFEIVGRRRAAHGTDAHVEFDIAPEEPRHKKTRLRAGAVDEDEDASHAKIP
jgi:hypothetical protein